MSENHPKAPQSVFTYAGHGLIRLATTGKYYARFKHHGKQIKKRLNTANKPRALRLLADLRAEASNVTSREAGRVTFANIGKRWIENRRGTVKAGTLKRDQDCIDNLEPYFRTVTLSGVTPENCESWKAKRGDAMAPQTFNRELGTLHAVFEFAVEQGIIWKNPARGIKRRRATATRSKQIPTDAQFAQILAAIRQGDGRKGIAAQDGADFVELLAYSGMRRSEAAALQWREVDFAKGLLTVSGGTQGTKNSETRTVPIGAQLRRLLERMHRQQQPEPTATVARIADPKKCLATAARKLGLPYFSPHRFRDFFATISLEKKTAPHLVASWLGHKDGGALLLKTYAHVRQEESKAAMDKLTFGPPTDNALSPLPESEVAKAYEQMTSDETAADRLLSAASIAAQKGRRAGPAQGRPTEDYPAMTMTVEEFRALPLTDAELSQAINEAMDRPTAEPTAPAERRRKGAKGLLKFLKEQEAALPPVERSTPPRDSRSALWDEL